MVFALSGSSRFPGAERVTRRNSIVLGVAGASFDDKTLGSALNQVLAATQRHGKYAMTLIGNKLEPGYAKRVAERGVQIIVLGTDGDLFAAAITSFSSLKS